MTALQQANYKIRWAEGEVATRREAYEREVANPKASNGYTEVTKNLLEFSERELVDAKKIKELIVKAGAE